MKNGIKILLLTCLVVSCQAQTNDKAQLQDNRFSIVQLQETSATSKKPPTSILEGVEVLNLRYAASLILPAVVHVVSTNKVKTTRRDQIPDFFSAIESKDEGILLERVFLSNIRRRYYYGFGM